MQTRDTDKDVGSENRPDTLVTSHSTSRRKWHRWFVGLGAFIVVVLLVGASAVVFSLAGQRHAPQSPNSGKWVQVEQGYDFISLVAAPSNPNVLYGCVTKTTTMTNRGVPGAITILRSTDSGTHCNSSTSEIHSMLLTGSLL